MTEIVANFLTIVFLLLIALVIAYRLLRRDYNLPEEVYSNPFSLDKLTEGVKRVLHEIVNKNISDLNLNRYETEKREEDKRLLKKALRSCNHGDIGAKEYAIDYIGDILQKYFDINETTIDKVIQFASDNLTVTEKFDILLHQYKNSFQYEALTVLIETHHLSGLISGIDDGYQITGNNINSVYEVEKANLLLTFSDKLDIVSRLIYRKFMGLSVIDEIRDMNIDGLSCGVAGVPDEFYTYDLDWLETVRNERLSSFDSIFIFFKGRTIRLKFLSFGSNKELIRVCKNVYKYGNPGQLSEARGYVLNEARDGARVVTFRPPFSASWAFFIRKYATSDRVELESLLKDPGKEIVILLAKAFIKAKLTIIITGEYGSGKTTFTKGLIGLMDGNSRIRTYEQVFELYINKNFPQKNVLSLRQIDSVSPEEALNIIKKTDGTATIIGEIVSHEEANWVMEINQVNRQVNMATGHMKTTDEAINYFTDAKLVVGKFNDAKRAEKKVVDFLNMDFHYVNKDGHRYLERITEVVPLEDEEYPEELADSTREFFRRITNYKTYKTVDIMRFEDGEYVIVNTPSKRAMEKIQENLSIQERSEFKKLFTSIGGIDNE